MNRYFKSGIISVIALFLVGGVAVACFKPPVDCYEDCNVTPSITPTVTQEVTPTDTPAPTEEVTPTATPSAPTTQTTTDDGLGCAHHDCNTHKDDKPNTVVPKAPPSTGYYPSCDVPNTCGFK